VGAAAGLGAGQGARAGLELAAMGGISIILAPITVPAGAILGSMYGAGSTVTSDQAAKAEGPVQGTAVEMAVQRDFALAMAEVLKRETAYPVAVGISGGSTAADQPVGSDPSANEAVLETRITEIGFEQQLARKPEIRLWVIGTAQLHHPLGWKLAEAPLGCASEALPATEWAKDQAARLQREAKRCYIKMAEIFTLNTLVSVSYLQSDDRDCGLKVEPLKKADWWRAANVTTLQPTLTWEAFPRQLDLQSEYAGNLNKISDISYEIGIWEGSPFDVGERRLIYSRTGLREPRHTLEEPLQPGSHYMFSVRTRFILDGQPRLTPWSRSHEQPQAAPVPRSTRCDVAFYGEFTDQPRKEGFYWLRTP
jgi:hypothetical protein